MDKDKIIQTTVGISAGVFTTLILNYLLNNKQKNPLCQEECHVVNYKQQQNLKLMSDVQRSQYIVDLIKKNTENYRDFGRLKIQQQDAQNLQFLEEVRFLDSKICEIVKVPHLILDLGLELNQVKEILSELSQKLPFETFVKTNEFILSKAAFGPGSQLETAKKWLRGGPRYYNYFEAKKSKVAIVTCDGLCPGLNVVLRELIMMLSYQYGCQEIYGARYGFEGLSKGEFERLQPEQIKTIHKRGGSYLGVSRGGFNKEKIIENLVNAGFNQLYVICGQKSMGHILELYYEIRKRKLNIAIGCVPRSLDNEIQIIDESFGYSSAIEEAQKVIENAWVESRSLNNGVGLIKVLGQKTGFIAMGASIAACCVNVCLIPEFQYRLYGKNGVLNYIYERLKNKGRCIIVISEGINNSFVDVECYQDDFGKFLNDEINKYCNKQGLDSQIKNFDPCYILRSVNANAYDTKLCSMLSQNIVNGVMAGFTGFAIGNVNRKTCFIPLQEILVNGKVNKIHSANRNWQRLLAQTGQPSFNIEEEEQFNNIEI